MMKKKSLVIICVTILFGSNLSSQNFFESLRYSQTLHGGTARFVSMGGAFGALGGDFSSLSFNPAGIGVYKGTEYIITPSFSKITTTSSFYNNKTDDYKYNFGFNNIGIISTVPTGKTGWVNINFGIGYNRLLNYHNNTVIEAINNESSLVDYFLEQADGVAPENLSSYSTRLGFDAYLFDTTGGAYVPLMSLGETQQRTIDVSGRIGEWVFSFGANYENRLYFGATLGIQSIKYEQTMNHKETSNSQGADFTNYFNFQEELITKGTGYNFKLGMIYKPIQFIRLGAALHLPTFYNLEREYYTSITANNDGEGNITVYPTDEDGYKLDERLYDYNLVSATSTNALPFKVLGSAALQFKNIGLLSIDYELIDYSTMRLRNGGDGYDFNSENDLIQDAYKTTSNIRVGGEVKIQDVAIRGGYAFYGSPYKSDELNSIADYEIISGGIGLNVTNNTYLNFAYKHRMYEQNHVLYNINSLPLPVAKLERTNGEFLISLCMRF
jgi:hypothetical protein